VSEHENRAAVGTLQMLTECKEYLPVTKCFFTGFTVRKAAGEAGGGGGGGNRSH
jgi:hypothetical protein